MNKTVLINAEKYIKLLLVNQLSHNYLFHSQSYTCKLVNKVTELLAESEITELKSNQIILATWFLNAGYTIDYDNHVVESIRLAKEFLEEQNIETENIDNVLHLVAKAWEKDKPTTKEEAIIKDIRTWFYASSNFKKLLQLLRLELESLNKSVPDLDIWRLKYVEKLRLEHKYYSDYAKENWQEQKEENVISLISAIQKANKTKNKETLKAKLKDNSPQRAIQSLYRIELRNHIKLSDIADTKANILLSVNAIIISLLLANLIPKLDSPSNSYLIYPTLIFILFSIASMIMSVLATRPKVDNSDVVEDEINNKNTNFLFFGNFHSMELNDFKTKLREIIKSKESIYDSLSMDLYYLGKVLQQKYKLLRWTYSIFIIGVIMSVIAFGFALKYFGMEDELLDAVTPLAK